MSEPKPRTTASAGGASLPEGADETLIRERPPELEQDTRLPVVERGRYTISRELAHGGIGRILQARDMRLDRPVAIKEMLQADAAAEARFVTEALLTSRLQHPSIIPVYEAGRWSSGEPFFAMKLVNGRSLADVISRRGTLAERLELLPHVTAVADAMAYAHTQRIIHRDLKPANVLVGAFGETVVIDWGLAKDLSQEDAPGLVDARDRPSHDRVKTQAGMVVGTLTWLQVPQ